VVVIVWLLDFKYKILYALVVGTIQFVHTVSVNCVVEVFEVNFIVCSSYVKMGIFREKSVYYRILSSNYLYSRLNTVIIVKETIKLQFNRLLKNRYREHYLIPFLLHNDNIPDYIQWELFSQVLFITTLNTYKSKTHRWCNGELARLGYGRSWVRTLVEQERIRFIYTPDWIQSL
jgi:hypothetical protein